MKKYGFIFLIFTLFLINSVSAYDTIYDFSTWESDGTYKGSEEVGTYDPYTVHLIEWKVGSNFDAQTQGWIEWTFDSYEQTEDTIIEVTYFTEGGWIQAYDYEIGLVETFRLHIVNLTMNEIEDDWINMEWNIRFWHGNSTPSRNGYAMWFNVTIDNSTSFFDGGNSWSDMTTLQQTGLVIGSIVGGIAILYATILGLSYYGIISVPTFLVKFFPKWKINCKEPKNKNKRVCKGKK